MPPAKLQELLLQAVAHHRANRYGDAEKLYARVRAAAPRCFDAWHLGGLAALQQNRPRDAAPLLRTALRLDPKSAICEMRLGVALGLTGELTAAESHLRAAVERDPTLAEAWCQLGATLKALGQLAPAREALTKAVALKPDFAEAHDRLGGLLTEVEGFAAAVPHFRRAVELQPNHATALANLGVSLAQAGAQAEALETLDRALALEPAHPLALTGRALVLQETCRVAEAADAYARVLAHHPNHLEARSGRLLTLHYLDGVSREELFREHAAFGAAVGDQPPRVFRNAPDSSRRLRVAFLSPDLRAHSVAYFLEPLVQHLDPAQFELFLYHDHPRVDAMSLRLQAHAAVWRHAAGLSHQALEALIRADAPDVIFDLAGHTGRNRLGLLARRLAPVQATYLGYPDTTGLAAMDYRFVDAVTDPTGEAERFHTEKLVRFAETAWSYAPPVDAPPPKSSERSVVTFGCFNNAAKISDATLRGWAGVLTAVPGSRLLLKGHGLEIPAIAAALRVRCAAAGIDPATLDLAGRTPGMAAHLALYSRVDVALDTFPYHGTTTTCEALWMGVPVVTLAGDRHAARVGMSLLTAAGHPEWIARDWSHFAQIAVGLAADEERRAALRSGLRDDLRGSPLLDHAGQAQKFGAAIREVWKAWASDAIALSA